MESPTPSKEACLWRAASVPVFFGLFVGANRRDLACHRALMLNPELHHNKRLED